MNRICCRCKIVKPLSEFNNFGEFRRRVRPFCKACEKPLPPPSTYGRSRTFEEKRDYNRKYSEKNKEKIAARKALRSIENKDEISKYNREYHLKNQERLQTKSRDYARIHKEERAAYLSKWKKENPDKNRQNSNKYRAQKLQAMPKWLTPDHLKQIKEFYAQAERLTRETGIIHVVDHVIPLKGKTVSGLHVPWNLQILTQSENSSKSNKLLELDGN